MSEVTENAADVVVVTRKPLWQSEDLWAMLVGGIVLLGTLAAVYFSRPNDLVTRVEALQNAQAKLDAAPAAERKKLQTEVADRQAALAPNPLSAWNGKLEAWTNDPQTAFVNKKGRSQWPGVAAIGVLCLVLFTVPNVCLGRPLHLYLPGFVLLFALAVGSFVLANQAVIKNSNLEYVLWALLVGLLISNTIGTPKLLKAAANTEFYIKAGLVLLGAEVLFHRLLALGLPGIGVAWVVTPIVLISTYAFGQRILKMESRSLNMVICADMSVCGVSAAIATAAACKAKKEELSLAIGLSLAFTVLMMILMPPLIGAMGLSPVLAGAWIGGTIDSTGAVTAAGRIVGPVAFEVATVVKMIQNILIGVIAFGVAVYWVTYVERSPGSARPSWLTIWERFPRFILGFVGASLLFSTIAYSGPVGDATSTSVVSITSNLRNWFFCLAFVSIGLETNFRELSKYLTTGKPLVLYVCGQLLNLVLTLFMAWLMFEKVFPDVTAALSK